MKRKKRAGYGKTTPNAASSRHRAGALAQKRLRSAAGTLEFAAVFLAALLLLGLLAARPDAVPAVVDAAAEQVSASRPSAEEAEASCTAAAEQARVLAVLREPADGARLEALRRLRERGLVSLALALPEVSSPAQARELLQKAQSGAYLVFGLEPDALIVPHSSIRIYLEAAAQMGSALRILDSAWGTEAPRAGELAVLLP